jgi:hypothetical protein
LEPPLCVVSNWIIRVYIILVWNTISGSSNLDICCYHCLILTLIFHLKVLINVFFFFIFIIIIINSIIGIITITIIVNIVVVLLLFIIYIINLPVVWPRSYRVIYYFNTPALGRRHQSFGRVNHLTVTLSIFLRDICTITRALFPCIIFYYSLPSITTLTYWDHFLIFLILYPPEPVIVFINVMNFKLKFKIFIFNLNNASLFIYRGHPVLYISHLLLS